MAIDKGIRPYCNNKFVELLPTRINSRSGNAAFRAAVMCAIKEAFSITTASASTHYNHSFQCAPIPAGEYREVEFRGRIIKMGPGLGVPVELLVGLGRADDKKGGRPKKAAVVELTAAVVETPAAEASPILLLTNGATPAPLPDFQVVEAAFAQMRADAEAAATAHATANPAVETATAEDAVAEQTEWTVCKKSDNSVVAAGLTKEAAEALVAKNTAAKKAKLYIQ